MKHLEYYKAIHHNNLFIIKSGNVIHHHLGKKHTGTSRFNDVSKLSDYLKIDKNEGHGYERITKSDFNLIK